MKYPHPKPHKIMTLAFLMQDGKLLLAQKLRGVGEGLWNGYGGKVESGEDIERGLVRELYEEAGVHAEEWNEIGVSTFHIHYKDRDEVWRVHKYIVHKWNGVPQSGEEMGNPTWFSQHELPFDSMWHDDPLWMHRLFEKKAFDAEFWFDKNNLITNHSIEDR